MKKVATKDTAVRESMSCGPSTTSAPFEILGSSVEILTVTPRAYCCAGATMTDELTFQFVPYSALCSDAAALCGGLADGGLPVDERRVRDIKRYFLQRGGRCPSNEGNPNGMARDLREEDALSCRRDHRQ